MSENLDQMLITTQIEGWAHHSALKRQQLLLNAPDPSQSVQASAFAEMGELCSDLIDELYAISAQLREESKEARFKAQDVIAASARLLAQHTRMTESQLLNVFKGDLKQRENPE